MKTISFVSDASNALVLEVLFTDAFKHRACNMCCALAEAQALIKEYLSPFSEITFYPDGCSVDFTAKDGYQIVFSAQSMKIYEISKICAVRIH